MGEGNQVVVSSAGGDVVQNTSFHVRTGDAESLRDSLTQLELPEELLGRLDVALDTADGDPAQTKSAALGWLADLTQQTASGALGGVIANHIPTITTLVFIFLGTL